MFTKRRCGEMYFRWPLKQRAEEAECAKRKNGGVLAGIIHVAVVPISEWRGCHHPHHAMMRTAAGNGRRLSVAGLMHIDTRSHDRLSLVSTT